MESISMNSANIGFVATLALGIGLVIVTDPRIIARYLNPGRKKRRRYAHPRPYGSPTRHYVNEE